MTYFFAINHTLFMKSPEATVSVQRVSGHQAGPVNVPNLDQVQNHVDHPIEFWRTLDGFKEITSEEFYTAFSRAMNHFTGVAGKYLTRKL